MKNYTTNQKELEKDIDANCGRPYQQCAISVMDTIADPNITFDEKEYAIIIMNIWQQKSSM